MAPKLGLKRSPLQLYTFISLPKDKKRPISSKGRSAEQVSGGRSAEQGNGGGRSVCSPAEEGRGRSR